MTPTDTPTSNPADAPQIGISHALAARWNAVKHGIAAKLTAEEDDILADIMDAAEANRDQERQLAASAVRELHEMTRRRDAWRKKAEGYDELAAAVRKGVEDAGPRDLGRIFLRGALVEQARRIEDLQAIVDKLAKGPAWGDSISSWFDKMILEARTTHPITPNDTTANWNK